jgi:hypothetical protein
MREVDLYSADGTIQQTQVKTEEQEYRPSPPRHSHQRAQVRKKFPYKCNTCNNQFPVSLQLQNHLVKHPGHHSNQGPLQSGLQCTRTSKNNAKRADVRPQLSKRGYKINPWKCTFCKNQFLNESILRTHFAKNPSHLADSQGTSQQPLPTF